MSLTILLAFFVLGVIVITLLLSFHKHRLTKEGFMPDIPIYGFPRPLPSPTYPYYSFQDFDYKTICPSYFKKEATKCNSDSDCGPSEVCTGVDEDYLFCTCSVRNWCIYDGVC